ncbi:MAG: helix-turn-helix domain-containing protein [Pseudomonadota bacterium]
MSITQTPGTAGPRSARRMDSASIGDLIGTLPGYEGSQLDAIEHLESDKERARFTALVFQMMDQFPDRGDPDRGRQRKRKILRILEDFSRRPPVTIDVAPIVWKYLYAAASRIAARDEHWDSACGPLIAASNAHLKRELGWNAARTNLARLAEYGLAVPYCLAGNGKRYFDPGRGNADIHASGWSLAPLLLLEDFLEKLAETERLLAEHHMVIPREITRSTTAAYQLIKPFEENASWAQKARKKLEAISAARRQFSRRTASRNAVRTLKRLADAAGRLLTRISLRITSEISRANPDQTTTRVQPEKHHLYSLKSALLEVDGLAGRRSGDHPTSTSAEAKDEPEQKKEEIRESLKNDRKEEDPYGIERSGFEWDEAPTLFPFIKGLIELGPRPGLDALHNIARISQIAQRTAARASGELGTEAALICALITGHHLAAGEIQKSADAYMGALIKRARSGELNLGHTLFGRRQAIYGRRDTKASNRVNDMQGLPH